MKKLIGLLMVLAGGGANAAVITDDSTYIVKTYQNYSTTAILTDSYTDVVLNLTAKGDYGRASKENIRFFIDGNLIADWTYSTPGISVAENFRDYDYTLAGSVSIDSALWDAVSADDLLNISWSNGKRVNPFPSQGGKDYVSYSLEGTLAAMTQVPEPASLALLGLGLLGLRLTRKANKKEV